MFYAPKDGHGLPHDPFKALVAPRPIGWISTLSADGVANLAPYSFFNAVAGNPPIVMFSSEGEKDSVRNARATGQFVHNFVPEAMADLMNATSAMLPADKSEFEVAGIAMAHCVHVAPPRVAGAPASLECNVTQIIQQHDHAGKMIDVFTVFGEVVGIHIDDRFLVDGLFDTLAANPIMRMGYQDYGLLGRATTLKRPSQR